VAKKSVDLPGIACLSGRKIRTTAGATETIMRLGIGAGWSAR